MRGKKAANLQMIYLVMMLLVNLIKFAVLLLVWTVQGTIVVLRAVSVGSVRLGEGIAVAMWGRGLSSEHLPA